MSAPKSVVKIDKDGVQLIDSCDRTEYFIHELTRAALRDVAKLIKKRYREEYYGIFRRRTGQGKSAMSSQVFSSKGTQYPRVQIGIKQGSKGKEVKGYYTFFHERGTKHEPSRPLLLDIVERNIDNIRMIEAQYLSGISTEDESMLPGEDEINEDDE